MKVVAHEQQETETWRAGVRTRMRVSAREGSHQLTIFEQWCEPGHGAPMHLHAVEEVLTVLAGQAVVTVGSEASEVGPGSSVLVPAGMRHGFRAVGPHTLHVIATLAAPVFEARYDDATETARRWLPER